MVLPLFLMLTHRLADRPHGVLSFSSNNIREAFFSRASSRAFFRISVHMVLRPGMRSCSRMRLLGSLTSEEGTRSSSARTAVSAPHERNGATGTAGFEYP